MYNDSVIQEQSGLNAFYNKIYSLVGNWCWDFSPCVWPDDDSLSRLLRSNLDNSTNGLLRSSCCRIDLGLCCKWEGC